MKGKIILPFFLLILLFTTPASASISDWIEWITGKAAEEEQKAPILEQPTQVSAPVAVAAAEEQVTCYFANSNSEQKCYGDAFSCAGTGSCTVKVSGEQGKQIAWKSSCGGYAYTTIDGNNENAEFKCETLTQPVAQPPAPTSTPTNVLESKEQVKCVFANSASAQKCYTDDGRFACSGTGSCTADVSGSSGAKLAWKSSCGSYAYTTIDGNNENAEFKCEQISAIPPCGNGACESGETCSSCPADCGQCATQEAKEQVTCIFANSNSYQACYSSDGRYKCSGTGSCLLDVYGAMGTKLEWKSSCGGYAYTFTDGKNENAEFRCETAIASTPTATTVNIIQTQTTTSTITPASTLAAKEQVKCVFANSASMQKCYTDDGRFGCAGTGSCTADVSGSSGAKLAWKSSCGGYAYTFIDGNNDYAEFNCQEIQTLPATTAQVPAPVEVVKEQVKCIFVDSSSTQECYSEAGGCKGTGTCVADVSGQKGRMLTWKSSCGGYAYSVIDGNSEYAEFRCGEQPSVAVQQPATTAAATYKKANIYVLTQEGCSHCDSEKKFIEQLKQKYADVEVNYLDAGAAEAKSYNLVVVTYLKRGVPATFLNDEVWNGFNDDIATKIEDEVKSCLERGCPFSPNPPVPSELQPYLATYMTKAPTMMVSPATGTGVKEQIRCIFHNSDVLLNPHTAKPEQCLTEDGKFGCIWDGNVMTEEDGERKAYCAMLNVEGQQGAKLTWKSSCGGYAYSVIDGNNEDVGFSCIPATNVTAEQIGGKGFMNAYWQCYDGGEAKSAVSGGPCKSSEVWQNNAQEFCSSHCHTYDDEGITKCGVNTFSVSGECYIDEKEFFSPEVEVHGEKKVAMPPDSETGDIMLLYFYMDACRHCAGMDEELNKVSSAGIDVKKINTASDADLAKSYNLVGVPSLVALRYEKDGIKEFTMTGKTDSSAILRWIGDIKGNAIPPSITEEKKAIKEEILICKDSCPLDGKCYPFGYRKSGRYCSDEGVFKEQLAGEMPCDNNFECSTNVCIDGKCMSSSMIKKVMDWFRRFFKEG